jgi:nucleotide-binding universal stress UspA family protein
MVPLDGSSFGEHALPLALEIARHDQARLLVVHVASCLPMAYSLDLFLRGACYAQLKRQRREYLGGVVRRLAKVSSVPVTPILLEEEDVAQSLGEMAKVGADLVVMATHGRGPFARFLRGSLADTLMRQLSIPVVVLRGSKESPDLASRPAVRKVLIPLDGSAFSEQVLEPVVAWGTLTDAEYTLVHVVDPETAANWDSGAWQRPADRPDRKSPQSVIFWRAAERLRERGLRVNAKILSEADPTQAVLRCAQAHGSDLIALATWGRGGLSRLFRGSVADRVIRGASVPVLAFRPMS